MLTQNGQPQRSQQAELRIAALYTGGLHAAMQGLGRYTAELDTVLSDVELVAENIIEQTWW